MPSRDDVRSRLGGLQSGSAETLEDERLEFLPWDADSERRVATLAEHVVAFANAKGGCIALGVKEHTRGRKAIQGVGRYDPADLRRSIFETTDPPIPIQLEELVEPEGKILLIHVPQGVPPHSTSQGTAKIRIGNETRPLTGRALKQILTAGSDRSAELLPDATEKDLDPRQIEALQSRIVADPQVPDDRRHLADLKPKAFLRELGLTNDGVTLAGMLLLGREPVISRHVPMHEVIFLRYTSSTEYDQRVEMRGPIPKVLETLQGLVDAHNRRVTIREPGFRHLEVPDISWEVAREAVMNAICHRDYWLRQGITVGLHKDHLEIVSPGGFVGGITPENILRHGPDHRNELLVRTLHAVGMVNRIGIGIDRIYRELLRLGKGLPRYSATESQVRLVVPLRTDERFALFVNQESIRRGNVLDLDDLLVLRTLTERASLDRWTASEVLQRPETEAAAKLLELRAAGYLTVRGRGAGTRYALTKKLAEQLGRADVPLDEMLVRQRLVTELHKRGSMTSAEIRDYFGLSKMKAYRLCSGLVEEGEVSWVKKGRSSYLTPKGASRK